MNKKVIVFSIGGKGGTGKSWILTQLVDWYESKQIDFRVFDLDNENNTISRFYPQADYIDVAHEQKIDEMMNEIIDGKEAVYVLDMRAASTTWFEPWFRNINVATVAKDYKIKFTAIGSVDSSADSVENIGFWARDVLRQKEISYVIARNLVRGEELDYDTSERKKEYLNTLGAVEITIPKLETWVHSILENMDLRINRALEEKDAAHPVTRFMNRLRLKRYQEQVFAEFEKIKDRLIA